jgi:hypothetical protein
MKSFEILNENMSMARRIKEVRSVFTSSHEKQGGSAYGKRKLFEKKCQLSNEELRHQSTPVLMRDFRKFQQWQRQRVSPHHKFQLALQPRLAKLAASHQEYAAVWCEVSTDKGFAKSELVDLKHFKGHVFNFALDHALPPDCLFRLFVSKGLDCEMAGQFQFRPPPVGQSAEEEYRSEDGRLEMQMRVRYDRTRSQKPLFTLK